MNLNSCVTKARHGSIRASKAYYSILCYNTYENNSKIQRYRYYLFRQEQPSLRQHSGGTKTSNSSSSISSSSSVKLSAVTSHKRQLSTPSWNLKKENIFPFNLKSPGGHHRLFSKTILSSFITRIPASIALLFLLFHNNDNHEEGIVPPAIVPFVFDYMAGPSMLPTILPVGDIYVRLNSWWIQLIRCNISRKETWQVGDVVVFKDPKGNRACKRIIGIEGDAVDILGQYVHLYRKEDDLGIRKVPIDYGDWEGGLQTVEKVSEAAAAAVEGGRHDHMIIVPKGMVWVEGDNPLYSVDSRHYGPISNASIVGKVVYRIWPRQRLNKKTDVEQKKEPQGSGDSSDSSSTNSCIMSRTRPHPMTDEEMFSGVYNIVKIPITK